VNHEAKRLLACMVPVRVDVAVSTVVRGTILQLATRVLPPAPSIDSTADAFSTPSKSHWMKRQQLS